MALIPQLGPAIEIGPDGKKILRVIEKDSYLEKIDVSTPLVTFIGLNANQSAADTDATWQVRRISISGNITTTEYADSGKFTQIWDDRESLFPPLPFSNDFSVLFDGTNDHALIGDVAALDFDRLDTFSISAWYKLSAGNERILFSKQAGGNNEGYRVSIQGGNPRFHLSGGAAGNRIEVRSSETTLDDGVWRHIVFVYDGSSNASGVQIYNDGVLDLSPTLTADSLTLTTLNNIDAQISGRNGTSNTFNGNIDEVSVWNTNLSAANVTALYNSGTPDDLINFPSFSTINIGWWRMGDGDIFPTLSDNSVLTSNNAIMTNMDAGDIVEDTP